MGVYDSQESVEKTFDKDFIPEEQLQTQWSEFIELKKAISNLSEKVQRQITILDIGVGNARVAKHLCGINEIWDCIELYHGIDNAKACVSISNKIITDLNIGNKATISLLEADQLNTLSEKYDIVMTTWFTAGNFCPADFCFETYNTTNQILNLEKNNRFQKIFSDAYNLLKPDGEIILGSVYLDNDTNRKKQEHFYTKLGMGIITSDKDSFTATRERFWSQRFTERKLLNYFHFVDPNKISFISLDTYDFAMQVRIKK